MALKRQTSGKLEKRNDKLWTSLTSYVCHCELHVSCLFKAMGLNERKLLLQQDIVKNGEIAYKGFGQISFLELHNNKESNKNSNSLVRYC